MTALLFPWILLLPPLLCALICLACPTGRAVMITIRSGVLATALGAAVCVWHVQSQSALTAFWGWLYLDSLSAYHLVVMMVVFVLSSLYLPGYFHTSPHANTPASARRFGALWFSALVAMAFVLVSCNIGLMWVGIEATTLVTAFLICHHRTPESIEATWKYLIICSVGVAFAFMGTLLAGAAANNLPLPPSQALLWTHLKTHAAGLNPVMMKAAFLFLLVGYGTKAGLAPMHSWLPDAHSQAPAPVSALFSGFMLNASLYCIMRYMPLAEVATGHAGWSLRLLLIFGLVSILVAAPFIVFQRDVKRLLAYCSVEHLGIIAVGLGLGGPGVYAALLHTLNHSICKSLAFFAAGRLGQSYGSHDLSRMAGVTRTAPVWGVGLLCSLLILIGVAPFAIFMSEFLILRAAAHNGAYWTMGLFLAGIGLVFVGALRQTVQLAWGVSPHAPQPERAGLTDKAIVAISLAALLVLGLWIPGPLTRMLHDAASIAGGIP